MLTCTQQVTSTYLYTIADRWDDGATIVNFFCFVQSERALIGNAKIHEKPRDSRITNSYQETNGL